MGFPIPIPSRRILREISWAVCFAAGYATCWLVHSNIDMRQEIKEQKQTITAHQKAEVASTKNTKQQQKFQTKMAKKGPEYVQTPSKAGCDDTDAEFNSLRELVKEANSVVDPSKVRDTP